MKKAPTPRSIRRLKARADKHAQWPKELKFIPREDWPAGLAEHLPTLSELWRSRDFVVQILAPEHGATRMTVGRSTLNPEGTRWKDGITWDDLQRLKRECGRGHLDAVEVYPADAYVVNVANQRHLWILDPDHSLKLKFIWR